MKKVDYEKEENISKKYNKIKGVIGKKYQITPFILL